MPLAPVLNQASHRWYTFEALKTMCINAISLFFGVVTNSLLIFKNVETETISVTNNMIIDSTDLTNSSTTDGLQNIVCEDD